jgi:protease-4
MKRFLKYFLVLIAGFALGIVTLIIIFAVAISSFSLNNKDVTNIEENSILTLTLPTEIKDQGEDNPFSELFGNSDDESSLGLNQIKEAFSRASKDSKIKGIVLMPGLYSSGLANADEIRNYISEFKKTQKWIIAYGEIYTEQAFYIASACNETYLNPKGMLEFNGLSSNIVMYKGMLDKLGVNFQVFRVGKFKGAVEPFIQTKLSDENKFQIKTYLESLYTYQVQEIAKSKSTSFDSLWNISMKGEIFTAKDAKSKQLVNGLLYENQVWDVVKNKVKDYKKVSTSTYLKSEDNYTYSENKIAVIYAEGEIMPGTNNNNDGIGSESFVKELIKAKNDKSIKAIVIRVNSPGGSSMASDIIAQEVRMTKKIKPVVVSFGNVAASGGYYISCVADSIFALPNTVTGSIGVFAMIANTENLFGQKLGLGYESVNLGEMSEIWRPDQALSPAQGMMMQKAVNDIYEDFIGIVSEGRKIEKAAVNDLAQGRVYSGKDALKLKLIDGLGGLNRALLSASRMAKIKEYRVVEYPESKSFIDRLMNKTSKDEAKLKSLMCEMGLNSKTISELKAIGRMQGMQMRLPWSIEIR